MTILSSTLSRHCLLLPAACLLLLGSGCDWLDKKATEVKQTAGSTSQQVVDRVKQAVNAAGNAELSLGGTPVKTSACYARLIAVGVSRPSVLKVTSYDDPKTETFPSLLFQAPSKVDGATALTNQTLSGQLSVQLEPDGAVWYTPAGQPATLTIQTTSDGAFTGTLAPCQLVSTEKDESRPCSGTFSGSLK